MKNQILFLVLIIFSLSTQAFAFYAVEKSQMKNLEDHPTAVEAESTKLSQFEVSFFKELNTARTHPELYASYVRDHLDSFVDEYHFIENGVKFRTNEGRKVVLETILYLDARVAMKNMLSLSKGLSKAARDHVEDHGPKGLTGHNSTDGAGPATRASKYGNWLRTFGENISYSPQKARGHVMGLIIDDGVLNRGHRLSIYNPAFNKVGVSCGYHSIYTTMCVIDLAGGYKEFTKTDGGALLIQEF